MDIEYFTFFVSDVIIHNSSIPIRIFFTVQEKNTTGKLQHYKKKIKKKTQIPKSADNQNHTFGLLPRNN